MLNLLRSMSTHNQKGNLFQFLSLRIASEAAPGGKTLTHHQVIIVSSVLCQCPPAKEAKTPLMVPSAMPWDE